jgi:hypothetical protein
MESNNWDLIPGMDGIILYSLSHPECFGTNTVSHLLNVRGFLLGNKGSQSIKLITYLNEVLVLYNLSFHECCMQEQLLPFFFPIVIGNTSI